MKKNKQKFNRLVPTKLAVWIIIFALFISSILVWKVSSEGIVHKNISQVYPKNKIVNKINTDQPKKDSCVPHYYEGTTTVGAWIRESNVGSLLVQIDPKDIKKLPASKVKMDSTNIFVAKLVDATAKITKQLKQASEKNPAKIVIQGYAEICQDNPALSLQPATIAFKKS